MGRHSLLGSCQLLKREGKHKNKSYEHGSAAFLIAVTGPAGAGFVASLVSLDPAAGCAVLFVAAIEVAAGVDAEGIPCGFWRVTMSVLNPRFNMHPYIET